MIISFCIHQFSWSVLFIFMRSKARRSVPRRRSPNDSWKTLSLSKRRNKLIKRKDGCIGVYAPEYSRFEHYKCMERRRPGESFSSEIEEMETNVLANEMVRYFSNLRVKGGWKSPNRKADFNLSEYTCHNSIYQIG